LATIVVDGEETDEDEQEEVVNPIIDDDDDNDDELDHTQGRSNDNVSLCSISHLCTFLKKEDQYQFKALTCFIAMFVVLFSTLYCSKRTTRVLLQFINLVILAFGQQFQLPKSVDTLHLKYGIDSVLANGIHYYVVCSKCNSLYSSEQARRLKKCNKMMNQGHSTLLPRPCKGDLYRYDPNSTSKVVHLQKVYAYQSLVHALDIMFARPGFVERLNHWRQRVQVPGVLLDVYDGRMWNEVKDESGHLFVDDYHSLLLTLNVDWFQAFSQAGSHSCGAIYLAINNLPRSERFKSENILLVGVMPGPKEAALDSINHYLRPLVDELESLYTSVTTAPKG